MSSRTEPLQSEGSLPIRIVQTVASEAEVSPTELEPLYETIDPDALSRFFESGTEGRVAFAYEGYRVSVSGDGSIDVTSA